MDDDDDTPRRADVEKTGGRRAQPASTSRQISDVLQPVWQVLRCSSVKSSVDNDRQFELDALRRSESVKTGSPGAGRALTPALLWLCLRLLIMVSRIAIVAIVKALQLL